MHHTFRDCVTVHNTNHTNPLATLSSQLDINIQALNKIKYYLHSWISELARWTTRKSSSDKVAYK